MLRAILFYKRPLSCLLFIKTNCKILKNEHITTTYRSFKNFNETQFLQDMATALGPFSDILVDSDINEACSTWIKTIQHQLDHHAPVKSRRVKQKRLPEWSNQEIWKIVN